MLVIPAIDLRGGNCVRLYQGSYEKETVYFEDPVKMAKLWRVQNAKVLHLVDLDAARGGSADCEDNRSVISAIASQLDIPVQVGGGVRTLDDVRELLEAGVCRVILGTAAVQNPELLNEAISEFGSSRVIVGIDARNGEVRTQGWLEGSGIDVIDLALEMEERGCRRIVYTDISRDGTMQGPNIEAYKELASRLQHARITASGGVSGYQDLIALQQLNIPSIDSVIVGRALYENAFSCQQIWCWNEKTSVDLDHYSTARLRTDSDSTC